MKFRNLFIALIVVALLSGCASIASKSKYDVTITSSPDQADVTITDNSGIDIYNGKTPTTVDLSASAGFFSGAKYTVKFHKDGYQDTTMSLNAEVDGWYFGNLLIGGVLGMVIIDPATGAMWKLNETCNANLVTSSTTLITENGAVNVAYLSDVPAELQKNLVPVN